jgi:SulP family sulfate permease
MSRFPLFAKLSRFGIRDSIILLVTFVLTVVFDLTYGVLGGVAVTFIANAKNIAKGVKIEKDENAETPTLRVKGTLFFLDSNKFTDAIEKELENADVVVVDLSGVERIDETALEKLVALDKKSNSIGKDIDIVGYNEKICRRFDHYFDVLR